ncbi:hypothetical protein LPB73_09680 [Tardiphaga sp. 37S4]|uniref:DUF7946 domain-containing protein n=1 Tax=Tardiphaga sp. 37S4 TaxID=1404741 RepID=UPI001E54C7DE|nr:hypothetical protein [Tardiphaga sp. 37S4]UFS77621.1 hypothetical protein LPB73_09680 [Tardiphaga sp. 37S4]
MADIIPFRLKLTGDTADQHQFQGYDGYMALAGFAWTLALIANYTETGKIRQRGEFPGRDAVRASAPSEGSIIADFTVWLQQNPAEVLGLTGAGIGAAGSALLYDVVRRVIDRNLGQNERSGGPLLDQLVRRRAGDIEALVAKVEPAIRQTHAVIGNGATRMQIIGGHNIINTYDEGTRDYVRLNVLDEKEKERDFSVSAFNVNSGYGSVFDNDLKRNVPISMSREVLRNVSSVFTWGLDQYANKTGGRVTIRYTRILAMDDTPKRYIVLSAKRMRK